MRSISGFRAFQQCNYGTLRCHSTPGASGITLKVNSSTSTPVPPESGLMQGITGNTHIVITTHNAAGQVAHPSRLQRLCPDNWGIIAMIEIL